MPNGQNKLYFLLGLVIGGIITPLLLLSAGNEGSATVKAQANLKAVSQQEPTLKDEEVRIKDNRYVPETVEIAVGDSVTWINDDAVSHTASRDDAPGFDTAFLAQGKKATITFNNATSAQGLEYFCRPHPFMKGRVVVRLRGSIDIRKSLSLLSKPHK